jgi:serpin B
MGIVLPAAGTFTAFRDHLDAASLAAMPRTAQKAEVDLQLPKFSFDSGSELTDQLAALGMGSAFSPSTADLTGIPDHPGEQLSISTVVEKTHVEVTEDGTTAAAAAGVGVGVSAVAPTGNGPVVVHADRPFMFLIRDTESGQVLFLGQVTQPIG